MIIVLKKEIVKFNDYLSNAEFRCRCKNTACKATIISKKFIDCFEDFRIIINLPIYPTSGYRCSSHNHSIGGKPLSRHLLGEAMDFSAKNLLKHWAPERVIFIAKQCGFTFVEYYKEEGFFHMDVL